MRKSLLLSCSLFSLHYLLLLYQACSVCRTATAVNLCLTVLSPIPVDWEQKALAGPLASSAQSCDLAHA